MYPRVRRRIGFGVESENSGRREFEDEARRVISYFFSEEEGYARGDTTLEIRSTER